VLQSMNTVVSNVHNIISSITVKFVALYMKDAVGCIKVTWRYADEPTRFQPSCGLLN